MATVKDWIQHLTTDVDTATEGIQVAGLVYPMVGSELWWVLAGIVFWLAWTFSTAATCPAPEGRIECPQWRPP